jgi:hypothetical protein
MRAKWLWHSNWYQTSHLAGNNQKSEQNTQVTVYRPWVTDGGGAHVSSWGHEVQAEHCGHHVKLRRRPEGWNLWDKMVRWRELGYLGGWRLCVGSPRVLIQGLGWSGSKQTTQAYLRVAATGLNEQVWEVNHDKLRPAKMPGQPHFRNEDPTLE